MPKRNSSSTKASVKSTSPPTLRLRVFAGPNGSGKSTIINSVREHLVNDKPIDFGYYINADDIARNLRQGPYDFSPFEFKINREEFEAFAVASGLISGTFTLEVLASSYKIYNNRLRLTAPGRLDQVAQLVARFLREQLLALGKRFSFETVFSHPSNLDIMKRATAAGYKVYLYFVSTESAEINKFRVSYRVTQGGHDVPEDKIESRYTRSLELLFDAAQIAYRAFFFDNSIDGQPYKHFADFRQVDGKKDWERQDLDNIPEWFKEYYLEKVK